MTRCVRPWQAEARYRGRYTFGSGRVFRKIALDIGNTQELILIHK